MRKATDLVSKKINLPHIGENLSSKNLSFLAVMTALGVVLAIPAAISLLQEPELETFEPEKVGLRAPASTGKTVLGNAVGFQGSLIELDCRLEWRPLDLRSRFVRMRGTMCKNVNEVEIVNESNGFSASIIITEGRQFTTDFIVLEDGENALKVTFLFPNGIKTSKTLRIIRRP